MIEQSSGHVQIQFFGSKLIFNFFIIFFPPLPLHADYSRLRRAKG